MEKVDQKWNNSAVYRFVQNQNNFFLLKMSTFQKPAVKSVSQSTDLAVRSSHVIKTNSAKVILFREASQQQKRMYEMQK